MADDDSNFNLPPKICAFIPSPNDQIKEWNSPKYGGFFVQVEVNGKLLDRVECRKCKKRIGMNSRRLIREHYNLHYAEIAVTHQNRLSPAVFSAPGVAERPVPFVERSVIDTFAAGTSNALGHFDQPLKKDSFSCSIEEEGEMDERANSCLGYGSAGSNTQHFEYSSMKCERDLLLINAVRLHPELYDPGDDHYRDNNRKTLVWEQIAQESGFSDGTIASRRWRSMRDYYIRLVRTSDNGEVKYTYALELGFLLEFVEPNFTSGEIDSRNSAEELPLTEYLAKNKDTKVEREQQQQLNNEFFMRKGEELGQRHHLIIQQSEKQQQKHLVVHQQQATVPDFFGTHSSSSSVGLSPFASFSSFGASFLRKRMAPQQQQARDAQNFLRFTAKSENPPTTGEAMDMAIQQIAKGATTVLPNSNSMARSYRNYVAKQASTSDFAPAGPSPAGEEDDAELFGRRVVKFLRSLSNGRRRRRACIGFEQVMIEFEAEEEEERKAGRSPNQF